MMKQTQHKSCEVAEQAPRDQRAKSRHGLTLIELMLVLVILVILASTATVFYGKAQDTALNNAARTAVRESQVSASKCTRSTMRTLPGDLNNLVAAPEWFNNVGRGPYIDPPQLPVDPWDNPYKFSLMGPSDFKIWSMGPDGTDGTADDISSKDQ